MACHLIGPSLRWRVGEEATVAGRVEDAVVEGEERHISCARGMSLGSNLSLLLHDSRQGSKGFQQPHRGGGS